MDCHAEDCEFYFFGGVFRGEAGIRRAYCDGFRRRFTGGKNGPGFGFLLDHPMMQDVVDVAPDRKPAKARFRRMMMAGTHDERDPRSSGVSRQWWEGALYGNSYVRMDGVWKIKTLSCRPVWHATHKSGRAYTPPHFVRPLTTTFPDDPYGPAEWTDIASRCCGPIMKCWLPIVRTRLPKGPLSRRRPVSKQIRNQVEGADQQTAKHRP